MSANQGVRADADEVTVPHDRAGALIFECIWVRPQRPLNAFSQGVYKESGILLDEGILLDGEVTLWVQLLRGNRTFVKLSPTNCSAR